MTSTRRRGEPPAGPAAAVRETSGAPVSQTSGAPVLEPAAAHFLLDPETADLLLGAALRNLATKVARHRWVALVSGESEPEAEIERLH